MFALCVQHYEDGWGILWQCVGIHHTHDTSASLGHNVCSCRQVYYLAHVSYHPEMKMLLLIQNPIYQPSSDHLPIQNLKMMMTAVEFQVESEVSSVRTKQVTTHLLAFIIPENKLLRPEFFISVHINTNYRVFYECYTVSPSVQLKTARKLQPIFTWFLPTWYEWRQLFWFTWGAEIIKEISTQSNDKYHWYNTLKTTFWNVKYCGM